MRMPFLIAALLPLMAGCAHLGADRLPTCDGQVRRPANPHGSVLLAPVPAVDAEHDASANPPGPASSGAMGACA